MNILTKKFKEFASKILERDKYLVKLLRLENVSIQSVLRYTSLKKIGYTYEDFLEDEIVKTNHKEKKAMYRIYCKGFSKMSEYAKHIGCSPVRLNENLRFGFDKRFRKLVEESNDFFELVELDYDLSKFEVEIYKNHIELYGTREDLQEFKKFHKIDFPILFEPVKNKLHLAFDGYLYEYIKYRYEKED